MGLGERACLMPMGAASVRWPEPQHRVLVPGQARKLHAYRQAVRRTRRYRQCGLPGQVERTGCSDHGWRQADFFTGIIVVVEGLPVEAIVRHRPEQ